MQKLFVDNINVFSLIWVVLHWFLSWLRISLKPIHIYYFAISPTAKIGLRWLTQVLPVRAEKADYSASEIIGDDSSSWYKTEWEDLRELCDEIREVELKDNLLVQRMGCRFGLPRILVYLEKWLAEDIEPIMRHIRVIEWYRRVWELDTGTKTVFFVASNPWHRYMVAYANGCDISMLKYFPVSGWRGQFAGRLFRFLVNRVRFRQSPRTGPKESDMQSVEADVQVPAKIAVPFIGKCLTLDPSKNSELFMLPHVKAWPGQVLLYFWRDDNPLNEAKREWLEQVGIRYVAINHTAVACPGVAVWRFKFDSEVRALYTKLARCLFHSTPILVRRNPMLHLWLIKKMFLFASQYSYWRAFYNTFNIKMHVTYLDWTADYIAAKRAF